MACQVGLLHPVAIGLAACLLGVSQVDVAHSAEWQYRPDISVGSSFETNPRNISEDEICSIDSLGRPVSCEEDDAASLYLEGRASITAATAQSQIELAPSIRTEWYSGTANDLDRTNYRLPLTYNFAERRSNYAISADYSRLGTEDSNFASADPNDRDLVKFNAYREIWSVTPAWQYRLSPRLTLRLQGGYEDSGYTKTEIRRFEYTYSNAAADLQWALRPKDFVSIGVNGSVFETDAPDNLTTPTFDESFSNDTDAAGISVGYEHQISENSSWGINVGSSRSDYELRTRFDFDTLLPCFDPSVGFTDCIVKGEDTNLVGDVFYSLRNERTYSSFSVGRAITPNSEGSTITQDRASIYLQRDIGERIQGTLGAYYTSQEDVGDITRRDADYSRVDVSLGWQFAEEFWVRARFSYGADSQTDILGNERDSDNEAIFIELSYQGRPRRF